MQDTFDLLQIDDIEKRSQRLETRNNAILERLVADEITLNTTEISSADSISSLNRLIADETIKLDDNTKRLDSVKKWMLDERRDHLKMVESMREKYVRRRIFLLSKLKALTARINSLEQYKNLRTILNEKFLLNEDTKHEREQNYKRNVDQVDCKNQRNKEILKAEMYKKLLDLSIFFQKETEKSNETSAICKLTRENIILSNEVFSLSRNHFGNDCSEAYCRKLKTKDEGKPSALAAPDTKRQLLAFKIQKLLLEIFHQKIESIKKSMLSFPHISDFVGKELSMTTLNKTMYQCVEKANRSEVNLYKELSKLHILRSKHTDLQWKIQRCTRISCIIKSALKRMLQVIDEDQSETINIHKLFQHFLNLMSREDMPDLHQVEEDNGYT